MSRMTYSSKSVIIFFILANALCFLANGASFSRESQEESVRGSRATNTLKFLVVVTRHGNRSPLYSIGSTATNSSNWPFGQGLTKVGREQLYNMGVKLRSLYNGFLPSQYFPDDVYVSSTNVERVVQSGELFMAGMYPASGNQVWNGDLLWNPIPVNQDSLDKTVASNMGCSKFTTEQTVVKAAFATEWADNITYFGDYVTDALNETISGTYGMVEIWDTLLCEDVEGFTLPDWAAEIYPDAMYPMMNDMYVQYVTGTDDITRLVIGPFFAEMMSIIESKINGTLSPDRKLYYWSGHDDTLITLQAAIGVAADDMIGVVNPGSAIVFEIHQNEKSKKYYIEISYIDGRDSTLTPTAIDIPDCGSPCLFKKFKANSAKFTNVTSENYSEACSS